MGKVIKKIGGYLLSKININICRKINGAWVAVPMINGVKVGISGEHWMSGALKLLLPLAKGTFYDVGVNLGQTLVKVKTIDAKRRYIGFEPNPSCLFYLQKLIEKNKWEDTVLVPVCLSDFDGLAKLNVSSDTDPEASIVTQSGEGDALKTKMVPVLRYQTIAEFLNKDSIGIIKIDVEGAEPEVLATLSPAIMKDRPLLLMEILPVQNEAEAQKIERQKNLMSQIRTLNYSLYRIMKSSEDHYRGILRVNELGLVLDPVFKDYVIIPEEKSSELESKLMLQA